MDVVSYEPQCAVSHQEPPAIRVHPPAEKRIDAHIDGRHPAGPGGGYERSDHTTIRTEGLQGYRREANVGRCPGSRWVAAAGFPWLRGTSSWVEAPLEL